MPRDKLAETPGSNDTRDKVDESQEDVEERTVGNGLQLNGLGSAEDSEIALRLFCKDEGGEAADKMLLVAEADKTVTGTPECDDE